MTYEQEQQILDTLRELIERIVDQGGGSSYYVARVVEDAARRLVSKELNRG